MEDFILIKNKKKFKNKINFNMIYTIYSNMITIKI